MLRLDYHDNALRLELVPHGIGNLSGEAFLNLGATGKSFDDAGQFRKASERSAFFRYVADMGAPEKRNKMMFAERVDGDVTDDDDLIVIDVEDCLEMAFGLLMETTAGLGIHAGNAGGGIAQAVAFGILADGVQDFSDRSLDPGVVDLGLGFLGHRAILERSPERANGISRSMGLDRADRWMYG